MDIASLHLLRACNECIRMNDKNLLTLLLTIYLFAIFVVVVGASSEAIAPLVKSGVNQEWLGFTGSVIGGLITAGAGAAVWIAAQRTINATRAIAERREDATYRVIQRELSPKVEMFVRYWRVVQRASKGGPEVKRNGETLIRSIVVDGFSENWFDELRKLGSDLSPVRHRELIDVLLGIKLVQDQIKVKTEGDNRSIHFYLLNLRTMLSHFERYLRAFDPEMARRFDSFTKSPIDHRSLAEHIDPLIEIFEKTGGIS
jgi:hypothetical protein